MIKMLWNNVICMVCKRNVYSVMESNFFKYVNMFFIILGFFFEIYLFCFVFKLSLVVLID